MKKTLHWLDENLEEFLLVVMLAAMTLIMGIQIFSATRLGSRCPGPRRLPVFSLSGAVF